MLLAQGPVGEHESPVVHRRASREPARRRRGADEREQGGARQLRIAIRAGDPDRAEHLVSFECGDLRVGSHVDPVVGLDAVDEVAGHAGVQVRSADHDSDGAARLGQEHRGLTGRIAAAGDHDGGLGAFARFQRRGGVVHALALEVGEPVDIESPVVGARGGDHGATGHLGAVGEADHEMPGLLSQRGGRARGGEVCAELLRLDERPLGQVGAGDPGWEAEVVLDA